MAYRVDSLSQPQAWLRSAPAHAVSAYWDMVRCLEQDPYSVGYADRRAKDVREYAFCVEGKATFVIVDNRVTVTIVDIR